MGNCRSKGQKSQRSRSSCVYRCRTACAIGAFYITISHAAKLAIWFHFLSRSPLFSFPSLLLFSYSLPPLLISFRSSSSLVPIPAFRPPISLQQPSHSRELGYTSCLQSWSAKTRKDNCTVKIRQEL